MTPPHLRKPGGVQPITFAFCSPFGIRDRQYSLQLIANVFRLDGTSDGLLAARQAEKTVDRGGATGGPSVPAILVVRRHRAARRRQFAVCVDNVGYEASLERNKIYASYPTKTPRSSPREGQSAPEEFHRYTDIHSQHSWKGSGRGKGLTGPGRSVMLTGELAPTFPIFRMRCGLRP